MTDRMRLTDLIGHRVVDETRRDVGSAGCTMFACDAMGRCSSRRARPPTG